MYTFAVPHVGEGLPFVQHTKWPMNMDASSYYLPPKSSKPSIQNLFRGRCYITDLKSLSQGKQSSHHLHLLSLLLCDADRGLLRARPPPPPTTSCCVSSGEATGPWDKGCWLQSIQDRVGGLTAEEAGWWGREKGGWEMWSSSVYLQDILTAVLTSAKCWLTAHSDIYWSIRMLKGTKPASLNSLSVSLFKHQAFYLKVQVLSA